MDHIYQYARQKYPVRQLSGRYKTTELDNRNILVVGRPGGLQIVTTFSEPADADDVEAHPPRRPGTIEVASLAGLRVDPEPDDLAFDDHQVAMAYLLSAELGHDRLRAVLVGRIVAMLEFVGLNIP